MTQGQGQQKQQQQNVTVIGAGVIGLSTAIRLQEAGYKVDIVAEFNPEDPKNIRYTSPWAGAHHVSVATQQTMWMHELDKETFKVMSDMLKEDPSLPMIFSPQIEYRPAGRRRGSDFPAGTLPPGFPPSRHVRVPEGVAHGAAFTCILIDVPHYLPYLFNRFKANGGSIHRRKLASLAEAVAVTSDSSPVALVNCTGLGAIDLVGDKDVFPTRGQLVIVRAPWVKRGVTRLGDGVYTYTIPRKSGDVIIGGTAHANDWDPTPRDDITEMIKRRGIAMCPELLPEDKRAAGRIEDLDVVSVACGLRPTRKGGVRLETEVLDVEGRSLPVVHAYGHGGFGYQSSWATARIVTELLQKALA